MGAAPVGPRVHRRQSGRRAESYSRGMALMDDRFSTRPRAAMSDGGREPPRGVDPRGAPTEPGRPAPPAGDPRGPRPDPRMAPGDPRAGVGGDPRVADPRLAQPGQRGGMVDPRSGAADPRAGMT